MDKLATHLIRLGHEHPELQDNLRPILDVLTQKEAAPHANIQKLIHKAEDAADRGDKDKAKEILGQAHELAERAGNNTLLRVVHRAFGRIVGSQRRASLSSSDIKKLEAAGYKACREGRRMAPGLDPLVMSYADGPVGQSDFKAAAEAWNRGYDKCNEDELRNMWD